MKRLLIALYFLFSSTTAFAIDAVFTDGEGIDSSRADTTFTVSCEDATSSNKGIAKFNTSSFTVSSGDVVIKSDYTTLLDSITADSTLDTGQKAALHTQGTDTTLGAMTANIDLDGYKVANSDEPTADSELATKYYVDNNGGGAGDVVGPAGATDNNIATFDTATGKLIQDGGSLISDLIAKSLGTTKGDIIVFTASATPIRLGVGDDDQILTAASGEASGIKWAASSAGGSPWRFVNLPAGSWDYPTANPAPLDTDTGTNGTIKRHLLDDTTEEFVIAQIKMPSDLDTAGTVYLEAYGYAVTADGNEIQLRLSHIAKDKGESWDAAYTTKDSGDYVTDSDQDELDEVEWNDTVSNLGWAADDLVRIMVSRIAIDDGTKLTGDWGLTHFRIKLPRE